MYECLRSASERFGPLALVAVLCAGPAFAGPQLELLTDKADGISLVAAPASLEQVTRPDDRFQIWSADVAVPASGVGETLPPDTAPRPGVESLGDAFGGNNPIIPLPPTVFGGALGLIAVIRMTLRRQRANAGSARLH